MTASHSMVPTRARHDLRLALALLAAGVVLAGSGQALAWGTDDAGLAADIVALLQLKPGDTVAEVGAGHGQMTVRLARAVGSTGRVYSTEIDPDLLLKDHLKPWVNAIAPSTSSREQ